MKASVIIPAYNCADTIAATLDSVLRQTVPPHEILVMDDGSTDETAKVLDAYRARATVLRQPNGGVASAFNALCERAEGDLIAFLGSDDIFHPQYLEMQLQLFTAYPNAAAFFTGHVNFEGGGTYEWEKPNGVPPDVEVIPPLDFFKRYNRSTGPFASYSYCCVPKSVLRQIGPQPFRGERAEDFYCSALLALAGPVIYFSMRLVAYRVRSHSLSSNLVRNLGGVVSAFELLEERYDKAIDKDFCRAFKLAFASHRRHYGKLLMSVGKRSEARFQFRASLMASRNVLSLAKSTGLLVLTYLPRRFQPLWPSVDREWNSPQKA